MKNQPDTIIRNLRRFRFSCVLLSLAGLLATGSTALAQTDEAKAILKSMSDYVSSQQTIELTFDSDIEVITPELEKIQASGPIDGVQPIALTTRPRSVRT